MGIWAKKQSEPLYRKAICMHNVYTWTREPYNHQQWEMGAYTEEGAYSGDYGTFERATAYTTRHVQSVRVIINFQIRLCHQRDFANQQY